MPTLELESSTTSLRESEGSNAKHARRQYSGAEKVAILKRRLVNGESIADICDALRLNPNLFYRWRKTFFKNGARAFEPRKIPSANQTNRRLAEMKIKLVENDSVISDLVTELIKSIKTMAGSERQMG